MPANRTANATAPAFDADAVTTSDTAVIPVTRSLYIGGTGDLVVHMADADSSSTVTFKAVPVGIFPVQVDMVFATGTTATNIVAMY